ncbi:hypothetical protein [Ideonella sp.]|uniref:hypothetical protein n=1 Tax=Ideonella sp. TaxID=1929293 RepID=UPI0035B3DE71
MHIPSPPRPAALTAVAIAAALLCLPAAAARRPGSPPPGRAADLPVDLADVVAGQGGFVLEGTASSRAGQSVSAAGDVNGDGLADLIVGAPQDGGGPSNARPGASYVVFGKPGNDPVDLAALQAGGTGGFVIRGEAAGLGSGRSVAGVGDVNGDGLDDLAIGVGSLYGPQAAQRSYIVFGKADNAPVELQAVSAGTGGFAVQAADPAIRGFEVAAAGDFDGDGLADLAVGVRYARDSLTDRGRSYVVFGQTGTRTVELAQVAQGRGGVVIDGEPGYHPVSQPAGAGDVNGDGLADLVIGVPGQLNGAGRSYVVFGRPGTAPVDLAAVAAGSGGFRLDGWDVWDGSGTSVAAAGDVNGDGLADVLVGAPGTYWRYGREWSKGFTYVVFGRTGTAPVALRDVELGTEAGFVIAGEGIRYDFSGTSVAGAGDINGDGLADVLIGAPGADGLTDREVYYGGRSYLVYGKADTSPVALRSVTAALAAGATFMSEGDYGALGTSVSAAGDVNGDGLGDLILGAPQRDLPAGDRSGRAYVVHGAPTGAFLPVAIDALGGPGPDTLPGDPAADSLAGGAGPDILGGQGGADVLAGGPGDDLLRVDGGQWRALRSPLGSGGNRRQLARLEGGSGMDTLAVAGAGVSLNLRQVAHLGMGLPGSVSRIASIERIDLQGSGANQLRLEVADVHDMTGMNLLNAGNHLARGWSAGTYAFPATVRRHQLVVDGDGDDTVWLSGAWRDAGTVMRGTQAYTVWNSRSGRAQVLLNQQVAPALAPRDAAR